MDVILKRFPYRYMEYEKEMMRREIEVLFPKAEYSLDLREPTISGLSENEIGKLYWLTFFAGYSLGGQWFDTYQGVVEKDDTLKVTKQHTRYSTHGIHEYKGKFNPQIVHCMINLFGIDKSSIVLDPFNGSGTTILECAHLGIRAEGADINPMACYIANSKVAALMIDVEKARGEINNLVSEIELNPYFEIEQSERNDYLKKWIPTETLMVLERIRTLAKEKEEGLSTLILTIASDLIRDYSFQEPMDLRIRRRKSPFPSVPLLEKFKNNIFLILRKIEEVQSSIGIGRIEKRNRATNCDIKSDNPFGVNLFDAVLTSPPYITALPYIDTQRISLVWLGLSTATHIKELEASLIGSREMLHSDKVLWDVAATKNEARLPDTLFDLVLEMRRSLTEADGFRKKAVPNLLYRYFAEMKSMFENVWKMVKDGAPFALIVGHNTTTLGGKKFFLNTPLLLAELAQSCGWRLEEIVPLETYNRYGINSKNAIAEESMVVLRKNNPQ